jgi:hypothetical protein
MQHIVQNNASASCDTHFSKEFIDIGGLWCRFARLQMSYFTMKIAVFLDIIGRDEIFSEHGFQVSGFRLALAFYLLTRET